jgi:hypothetical protein
LLIRIPSVLREVILMAEREMSGKVLLDKLYSGLNTMPAAEAARDFRRLNDDFLGKPADLTASDQHAAEASDADDDDDDDDDDEAPPSTSRAKTFGASLVVVCLVGLAGVIAFNALRKPEQQAAAAPPPAPAAVVAPAPAPVEQVAEAAPPESVVLTNPFDKSEKFTFPPGTSKAEAREQMANLLLQRAMERGANKPRARSKLAAEPRKPSSAHGS